MSLGELREVSGVVCGSCSLLMAGMGIGELGAGEICGEWFIGDGLGVIGWFIYKSTLVELEVVLKRLQFVGRFKGRDSGEDRFEFEETVVIE